MSIKTLYSRKEIIGASLQKSITNIANVLLNSIFNTNKHQYVLPREIKCVFAYFSFASRAKLKHVFLLENDFSFHQTFASRHNFFGLFFMMV